MTEGAGGLSFRPARPCRVLPSKPTLRFGLGLMAEGGGGLGNLRAGPTGGLPDQRRQMSVATGKGLAMISPDEVKPNTLPPPVRIQEILVDGQTLELPTSAPWIGADLRFGDFGWTTSRPHHPAWRKAVCFLILLNQSAASNHPDGADLWDSTRESPPESGGGSVRARQHGKLKFPPFCMTIQHDNIPTHGGSLVEV